MASDSPFDPLKTLRCPIHSTERLVADGSAPDGRDARWQYPVADRVYSQLA